ncbi:magnesium/cobalt transporter CorA [Candidatus Nitrosacidococcus sp. I8]|uniref:magnesium/cobalt transporter CorA n=1 Tax=Candidatus Nitrosacidococcus sp. I8 TaxID=2942908 RepID=UPI002226815E|nr:magnesium/cobalt transporter CorA [Candidatus Nitrosacidococcus sp. I8]
MTHYTKSHLKMQEFSEVSECQGKILESENVWVHIQDLADYKTLLHLAALFNIHPLAVEDIFKKEQRPKIEPYEEQLFIVLGLPTIEDNTLKIRRVGLFLGKNYLISFCDGVNNPFTTLQKKLHKKNNTIQAHSIDYLFYTLVDSVIDQGFPLLESKGEEVENLEEILLFQPTRTELTHIHRLKRELLHLRRIFWPQREVVNALLHMESDLIRSDTQIYLRDCYDHSIQLMELLETYRDMAGNMLDLYLSSISNHTNEIMRVLTIISTIFIPLTFIVGVYGMNFESNNHNPWAMPELRWHYGYPIVWLVMISIVIGLLVFFKKRKWF